MTKLLIRSWFLCFLTVAGCSVGSAKIITYQVQYLTGSHPVEYIKANEVVVERDSVTFYINLPGDGSQTVAVFPTNNVQITAQP